MKNQQCKGANYDNCKTENETKNANFKIFAAFRNSTMDNHNYVLQHARDKPRSAVVKTQWQNLHNGNDEPRERSGCDCWTIVARIIITGNSMVTELNTIWFRDSVFATWTLHDKATSPLLRHFVFRLHFPILHTARALPDKYQNSKYWKCTNCKM